MTTTDQRPATGRGSAPAPWTGSLWGSSVALIGNSLIFLTSNAMLAGSIQTAQSGQTPSDLPYAAIVAASVIPVLAGAAVLWGLTRFTRWGLTAWSILAGVLTLLSLLALVAMQVDTGSKAALGLMHLFTGAAAIWGQRRAAKPA
jgi:hypothetical protein